jgi:thiosulfate/3-mercaptopyruvate sulfurtransferase
MPGLSSPIVSVEWLRAHVADDNLVIVDVRPLDAYLGGHIPGAIHADLSPVRLTSSSPAAIADWHGRLGSFVNANGLGPDKTVVFYEDFSGTIAAYGVWLLDAAGLGNGAILDGGFRAWHEAGLALAGDRVQPVAEGVAIEPNAEVLETADQILASLNEDSRQPQLVDTRANHEFGMGSIPGAVHVDWTTQLNADGTFRPLEELDNLYATAGLEKSEPVASYCAGGIRAANTYVVLKALGYAGARNYAPSWSEWGTRADTPVVRHKP